MRFRDLQQQHQQLTAAMAQLQSASEPSTPLSPAASSHTPAVIARGQQLQALEQERQQVAAALAHITTLAQQHGLLLPPQKSHDCAVQHSSDSNEWYTIPFGVDQARELMSGIDLDPASSVEAQSWIQAQAYYTQVEDGLQQPWFGRLWLNPPYGKRNHAQKTYGATVWVQRAIAAYQAGHVMQAVLWLRASGNAGIRALEQGGFPRVTLGRIPHAPPGANGMPQKAVGHDTAVWYLGPQTERFQALFVRLLQGR
jgi:hypothetical protein